MKVFLGTAGIPLGAKGNTVDGINYVKSIGLNAMEVEFVHGVNMGLETAKSAGKVAKNLGVRLSVHAPYYINLCNPEKKKASEKRILDSCERAHHLGAKHVIFHPGYYGNLSRKEALGEIMDSCSRMEKWLTDSKMDGIFLSLETTGKKSQFGELSEIVEVCKEVKRCRPAIDFAHIYARSGGKIDYSEIFEAVKPLKIRNMNCHFSGIEFTDTGERRHMPICKTGPDFKGLAEEIIERSLTITIICESPLLEKDALVMKKILEKSGYSF